MKSKRKWTDKRKFSYHVGQIERLIMKYVGDDNYAGRSSLNQLDCIIDKFMDTYDFEHGRIK